MLIDFITCLNHNSFKMNKCDKNQLFCYVCGKHLIKKIMKNITDTLVKAYDSYFGKQVIKNQWWVPTHSCESCYRQLLL